MPEVTLGEDCVNVPEMGMLFKDKKDIYEFYKKKYTYAIHFSIEKMNSKKGNNGVLRYVTLTCSREGRISGNTNGSLKP